MGHLTVGLCVLFLFASANAFYPLIPEGKELIYHYHGLIRAGSHLPSSYASAFVLDGKLHVQTDKNSSFMHFSDLKYKMYNGAYDEWHEFETKEISLPKELEVFEHPFKVVYEPCGHAWGIVVEADEPQYSINVKRGLASIMQMYTEKLDWTKDTPYSFHTKENTLYGKGPYYYTVYPGSDEWTVKKMAEPHSNHHLYAHMNTESKMGKCDAKYDEPMTRDSFQEYTIVKKDGMHVMESMESNAGIFYTPYAGEGYAFHIYMNQTMELEKIETAAAPMTIKSEKFYKGLTYYTADFNTMEGIADVMNGRRTYDMEKMLVELEEMLYDTMKYVKEYHLDMKLPEWARGQLVNRMLVLMYQLDQAHLEAMTAKLMQKTTEEDKEALHVYYHMLPMIGSHASYMYMVKLMKTKKIKDKLALEWLQNMPFHVKEPNKMLMDHMSEMLNWGEEISMDVRKAAIMAFGTFLEKAMFRYNKLNHINNWSGHEGHVIEENFTPDYELDAVFPGAKYYEKYIAMLGDKMKTTKDHGLQAVYISALFNTRMEKAIHYLWPVARGEIFDDHYLRMLAITSLGVMVRDNEELVYEIFWPIMSDYKLRTNIRIAALYQIMKTHPSQHRLSNLMWQMQNEPNYAFYQFYYSYMESVARTTDYCMENFKIDANVMLRYLQKPEYYGMTGYYEFDYMDTKYEYGHQFTAMLVKAPGESETTLKLEMAHTVDNAKFQMYGFLIHVDGMEASILEDVMLYVKNPNKMLNFEKVWKAYQNIYNNKEIEIDIAMTMYGQVVMNYHYDHTNIKEISTFLDLFVGDKFNYVKKYFSIVYPMQTNVIMPTEMGFPAIFKIHIPKVYFFDVKITKDVVNNLITWSYDAHMKEWAHGHIGLHFYNPFINMYQGVQRIMTFEWVQPIYFDLTFNPTQQSMKLTWKRHDEPQKDAYGIKSYAATFTFFRDDLKTGLLKQSSPECDNWVMVTVGDEHREKLDVLYDEDCSKTGFHHMVTKFDSDIYASNLTLFKNYNHLHYSQNYHTCFGHWFLTRFHALVHSVLQPYEYANGILVRSEVSKQYPVTNIDMNIRFTRDYKRGDMMLYPATKWNIRATYSPKVKDTTLQTFDVNMIVDTNMGHTVSNIKAIFSRLIPGQKEWRMCVDGTRKYTDEGIEGEATIAMDHAMEAKCTKDEKVMEIKLKAEKLEEQKDNKHMYGECEEHMWSDIHEMNSLDCYWARDTLRRWTYDFHTFDMPTEFKHLITEYFGWMKSRYMRYLTQLGKPTIPLEKGSWKIVNEYPLIGDKVDMHVYTAENDIKFGGIPADMYTFYNYHMMSAEHFSPMFMLMHRMGWTQVCEIHQQHYFNSTFDQVEYTMPNEWTMYFGDSETDGKHGIWMKNLKGDDAAMKMMHGEHSLEIVPTGHKHYDVMVDGKKLPENTYQYESEWFWMDWVKESGVFSVFCMHTGSHIIFDGHHLLHESPNMDAPFYGKCA